MDTTANTLAVYRKEVKYLISLLDSVMRKGVSCAGHRMCRSKSPVIIVTGILGNILADTICRLCKIEDPIAKGLAIGTSAHALGTAKAMELGEIEGAMSSLSIVVCGILTVISVSIFANFI